jgi:hypothetical protein
MEDFTNRLSYEFGCRMCKVAKEDIRMTPYVLALHESNIQEFTAKNLVVIMANLEPNLEEQEVQNLDSSASLMDQFLGHLLVFCQSDEICQKILTELSKLGQTRFHLPVLKFNLEPDNENREEGSAEMTSWTSNIFPFEDAEFRSLMEGMGLPDPDFK